MSSLIPRHTKCLGTRQVSELLIIFFAFRCSLIPRLLGRSLGMGLCRCIRKAALGYVVLAH